MGRLSTRALPRLGGMPPLKGHASLRWAAASARSRASFAPLCSRHFLRPRARNGTTAGTFCAARAVRCFLSPRRPRREKPATEREHDQGREEARQEESRHAAGQPLHRVRCVWEGLHHPAPRQLPQLLARCTSASAHASTEFTRQRRVPRQPGQLLHLLRGVDRAAPHPATAEHRRMLRNRRAAEGDDAQVDRFPGVSSAASRAPSPDVPGGFREQLQITAIVSAMAHRARTSRQRTSATSPPRFARSLRRAGEK